jgi:hypothetical protein
MSSKLIYFAILITTFVCSQTAFADVKIKSKQTMSGQSYENTTYIKGKRQRTETMNGMMVNITQCDLRRGVQINPNARTYLVNPFATTTETVTKQTGTTTGKNGVVQSGGTVTTTIITKDTGERKLMFGYTARHLIITMEMSSSPDACSTNKMKMETDGWYIDFEPQFDCGDVSTYGNYNNNYKKGGCQDKYVMKTVGTAKRGYAVYEKMTMFDESGKETMSMLNEVVELSKATLDAGLFDVPADYREVSDASQMYASMGSTSASTSSSTPRGSTSTMSLPNSGGPSTNVLGNTLTPSSSNNGSAVGPKQAGTIRIGLAGVKTGAVGEGLTAGDLSAAVQNTLVNYLKVPNIEVITLEAKLTSAIDSEAKQKECDYVIYTTVSHKKGGGGFGSMFGSALGTAIGSTGIGHTGSTAGNIAGQIATQAIVSSTNVAANVKSKDEIMLDLKLNNSGGASAFAKVYKAKAKSNGEDIISAVIEQAAQAIVDTVGK